MLNALRKLALLASAQTRNSGDYFSVPPQAANAMRNGRSVQDGYQRGWGLEFGDLKNKIASDPDYVKAFQYAAGRSVVKRERLMNLFLLIKFFMPRLPRGNIIEFGAYRGGSALFMAALAAKFLPGTEVYALDTFEGMPETDKQIDKHMRGDFNDSNFEELTALKEKYQLNNLHLIKGLFSDTAPGVLAKAGPIALAHIDCDIYEAVKYAYLTAKPHMAGGGYIVFDDSTVSSCLGATEVVEDIVIRQDGLLSEQIFPHHVFRANFKQG
jgi:predicted O-methyltransferase YrrM